MIPPEIYMKNAVWSIRSYCIFSFGVLIALLRFFSYGWLALSLIIKGDYMNSITELLFLEGENLIVEKI